ncbi:hypothetical protein ACLOJK_027775 [Asimina triloba]
MYVCCSSVSSPAVSGRYLEEKFLVLYWLVAVLCFSDSILIIDIAGASLESLAKGAVCFSRRFTIQELQDRWHSLLYDPDISAEASARIVEIELSVSNLSKANRSFNVRGKEWRAHKRKADSVRSHYYAMRKRFCQEPCNSADLDFLVPPVPHFSAGNDGGYQEELKLNPEHAVVNCMQGSSPVSGDFEFQDAIWAMMDPGFPQISTAGAVGNIENDLSNQLYVFPQTVSSVTVDETGEVGTGHSFEHDNLHKDIPHVLEENLDVYQNCADVQKMGHTQPLPGNSLFENTDNHLEAKSLCMNNNQGISSGFEGNQNFSSPISDSSASFHQLGYSSSVPGLPIWKTTEEFPTPSMPIETNLEGKNDGMTASMALPCVDIKKTDSPQYDAVHHSESKMNDGLCGDGLGSSAAISEGDLLELSNYFGNYMDVDEKDMMDRSCLDGLNSILLSSPNDEHQDDIHNTIEPEGLAALDRCTVIAKDASPRGLDGNIDGPLQSDTGHVQNICDSELNFSAPSSQDLHSSQLLEGFIICTLNTEDPEIPCNDDIFPPSDVLDTYASSLHYKSGETSRSFSSSRDVCDNPKTADHLRAPIKEEREAPGRPPVASLMLSKVGSNYLCSGSAVKAEFPESNSLGSTSFTGEDTEAPATMRATSRSLSMSMLKNDVATAEMGRHGNSTDSFLEKSVQGCKSEVDLPMAGAEMGFLEPAVSDPEELPSESDDDVPNFSDIEAMILDMDLGPYDEESNFTREVARYQYEDTKKAIIRLEQGACSYMQRAITSHGAFAVFYGRRLRHYIKKSEVTLGRATEDVSVDIDLGREGRANKISRRQTNQIATSSKVRKNIVGGFSQPTLIVTVFSTKIGFTSFLKTNLGM